MPMRGELDVAVRRCVQTPKGVGWSVVVEAIWNRGSQAIVAFGTIGILATINAVLYFPDFGAALARLAIFP